MSRLLLMVAALLRLTQTALPDGRYRVTVTLREDGEEWSGTSDFDFTLSEADREDVRWYLEDYLEYPLDPAPAIAARVEGRLQELGRDLFAKVFAADNAREAWAQIRHRLGTVRVEVDADADGAAAWPWELLLDPKTGQPVAVQVESFVRVHRGRAVRAVVPDSADRLRLLLVICRPAGRSDVPFRSVASHLIRLGEHADDVLDVDVLRPPTFERLTEVLEAAHRDGRAYHAVHFDGHGTYVDPATLPSGAVDVGHTRYSAAGPHGYLLFEDPDRPSNQALVGGSALGALLARTGVGVLLLNACRSAYTEAPDGPQTAGGDPHERVRAYGSLALEVAEQGVGGVVAMRYNVYVVTAAQFVANLYTALLAGRPLGEAVTAGRKQLWAKPDRVLTDRPRPLQDWSVPVVYEAVPAPILKPATSVAIDVSLSGASGLGSAGLPRRPDAGFFGRDETLLALDRAFDRHRIVLLHGYAGGGKTTTAVEFARWYQHTGGLHTARLGGDGPVVFSSLEHYKPLRSLLNDWGAVFGPLLSVEWSAINDDADRREIALRAMRRVPVLWVWDNVEPVAGFPAGTASAWSPTEQAELADFLRDLAGTEARVLLTSRRDERGWLGSTLPRRIRLPAMPMREMIQLASALADRHGHRITDVEDWRPLLRYAAGNPLTVTVLVGQVLRQGLLRRDAIESFVARLRSGEADLDDDEAEGRTRSLAASLDYGFATAFTDSERAQLGVLHLFRDFIDVDVLVAMGQLGEPTLATLDRESGVALLDRAADLGLLTAYGHGYYRPHPALGWFLRRLSRTDATAAYTAAIGEVGAFWGNAYIRGRRNTVANMQAEEQNLLHAIALGRGAGQMMSVMQCLVALDVLYSRTGRMPELRAMVEHLNDDFIDPQTGGPRDGTDEEWPQFMARRILIATHARDWETAHRLHEVLRAHRASQAGAALAKPSEMRDEEDLDRIQSLAIAEADFGAMLFDLSDPACIGHLQRAHDLFEVTGRRSDQSTAALFLGNAFLVIHDIHDLDEAERWYRRCLDLADPQNRIEASNGLNGLGLVAAERFQAAPTAELFDTMVEHYQQALDMLPEDSPLERSRLHNALGTAYTDVGLYAAALQHFQRAIRHLDDAGEHFSAGETRFNAAVACMRSGRPSDALLYARSALRDFQRYGAGAAAIIARAEALIAGLEGEVGA